MAASQGSNGTVHEVSAVARWYENRSVFITGATGFMGKVLVERLLTTCPGINQIFVLLRRKKDISPEKRLEQMKQTPVFDNLRRQFPQRLEKLVAISGDILQPELGISSEELAMMTSSVSVVFHSAATVKFDEALRLSVTMNVLGTRRVLNIAKKLTKLEALIHVSTAYSNCDRQVIEEVLYPPPVEFEKLLMCLECMDDDMLEVTTSKMIGKRPNTYTFSKAMAEHIVMKEGAGMPISIIRPSIVCASLQWPMPGWVDNLNGPSGVFAGAGKGVLRTLYCRRDCRADIIPVDICINAIIVAAWNVAKEKHLQMKVYNVTTGEQNPIHWGQLEVWGRQHLQRLPYDRVLWYPGGSFKDNKTINNICINIFHMVPAYIMDTVFRLTGRKPYMVKMQVKIQKAMQVIEPFTTNQWTFLDTNVRQLFGKLNETDKKMFNFDVKSVDWRKYFEQYVMGVRRYVLKENDEDLPAARVHMRKMFIVHYVTKALVLYALWRIVFGNSLARKLSYNLITLVLFTIKKMSSAFRN